MHKNNLPYFNIFAGGQPLSSVGQAPPDNSFETSFNEQPSLRGFDGKSFNGQRHCEGSDSDEAIQKATPLKKRAQKAAFSLVEMLMALLVASLLMAALAPVMTKRMNEAKLNISGVGAAQYDKDALVTVFTGEADEDKEFFLPEGVSMMKVTLIGGGGAGGNSFYGKQEITETKTWTVPAGVTKLRVFMLGGGGGGASGGLGTGVETIPGGGDDKTTTYKDFGEGLTEFTIPSTATKVPALDAKCAASGSTKWTGVADGRDYIPGDVAVSVTACGGGGGGGGWEGGYGGGGGTGGYVENIQLSGTLSKIYIVVGGGGGGGGSCGTVGANGGCAAGGGGGGHNKATPGTGGSCNSIAGGKGGTGSQSNTNCNGGSGTGTILAYGASGGSRYTYCIDGQGTVWSAGGGGGAVGGGAAAGGGGGPTTVLTSSGTDESKIIFQIGGGAGGGGGDNGNGGAGGGGAGGGYGSGGGGGGGYKGGGGTGGNGYAPLFASIDKMIQNGKSGATGGSTHYSGGSDGGGGGGGYGGRAGNTDVTPGSIGASTVWKSSSYCDGGSGSSSSSKAGSSGMPGRLRLYYTYPDLQCDFHLPANGSGGGGAGQLVVGEIDVTPGEVLQFTIGSGGGTQALPGTNGKAGADTVIRSVTRGVTLATALGGFPGQYSMAETTPSHGGSYRTNVAIGSAQSLSDNWTGISYNSQSGAGANGQLALPETNANRSNGGKGGDSQNMKGDVVSGGSGGNSVKNGMSPLGTSYGAGGGGGAGSRDEHDTTFGIGAAGASGYIYFEYGGSNGGGGTAGEMITQIISNLKTGTKIDINVGAGGDNSVNNGKGGSTTIKYNTGTEKTLTARGGLRGNDGLVKNQHGAEMPLPDGNNKDITGTDETYANRTDPATAGQAGNDTSGGIGGYITKLFDNEDGSAAAYIKATDGKIGGPVLGGCGGNLTALMGSLTCNGTMSTPNGKDGVFGGGGGGGAVVTEVGGLGGKGGRGMIILEYKGVGL